MQLTCDAANKMVRELNDKLARIWQDERSRHTYTSTIQRKELDRPAYDFLGTQATIDETNMKILKLKHAINKFNVAEVLPCGLTIDEALCRMAHLNEQRKKLRDYLAILEIVKPDTRFGSRANPDDYIFRNFDVKEAEAAFEDISNELIQIQSELNVANVTKTFEVDL